LGLPAAVATFQAATAEPLLLRHSVCFGGHSSDRDRQLAKIWLSNPTLRIESQKIPNRIKSQSLMPNQSQNLSNHSQKTLKSRFKSQSRFGFSHHWLPVTLMLQYCVCRRLSACLSSSSSSV